MFLRQITKILEFEEPLKDCLAEKAQKDDLLGLYDEFGKPNEKRCLNCHEA